MTTLWISLYFAVGVGYGFHKLFRIRKSIIRSGQDYIDWIFQVIGWPFAVIIELLQQGY